MRAKLPAYPELKPLPGTLFGAVPSGWRPIRLKFVMPYVTVGIVITPSKYYVDDGVPAIRSLNVKDGRLIDEDLVFFSEEDNRKLAKTRIYKDDVVIVRTGQTGSCAVVDERFHGANCIDLIIVRKSRHLRSRFLHYFLASGEAAAEITMSSNGAIQQHFNIGLVREIGLLQPSSEEQDAILTFLDRETAKIDRLMAVRQKQVERLQEQRTAVIHHAVTKGLDPQAKMKPSGVEWLGEVPEGWATYRLRHLLRPGKDGIRIGPFGSSLRAEFIRDEGYKVYGQENVIGRSFQLGARHVDTSKFNELSDYALRPGDVLITMMGSIGRCIVVPEDIQIGIMDSHLIRVGVDERKVRPRYLALLIEEAPYVAACIQNESKGSIMDGLNSGIIKRLTILLPTIEEQQLIMEHLARETAKIDTLIAKYQRELELLAEYRASLISHAVTGKIDVRGLVEPIPSEAP